MYNYFLLLTVDNVNKFMGFPDRTLLSGINNIFTFGEFQLNQTVSIFNSYDTIITSVTTYLNQIFPGVQFTLHIFENNNTIPDNDEYRFIKMLDGYAFNEYIMYGMCKRTSKNANMLEELQFKNNVTRLINANYRY
jgi:hypothetical protein